MKRRALRRIAVAGLYACAALQFVRYYTVATPVYLDIPRYMAGTERLPFQERVLPAILLRAIGALLKFAKVAPNPSGAFTAGRAPLFLLALFSFIVAALCTQLLYNSASKRRPLAAVVFPVFLFTMMWTYTIHSEANFAYPYDFPAVAFFAAGLVCIYRRRFVMLLAVVLLGTFNRETTLFLILIFCVDGLWRNGNVTTRWKAVSLKTLALLAIWIAIKVFLGRHYAMNNRDEDYIRFAENVGRLKPRLWPALLNLCGYVLPLLFLFYDKVKPQRIRRFLLVFPVWFVVMFAKGVIVETRIFGELCPLVAVAAVLAIENAACEFRGASTPADVAGSR